MKWYNVKLILQRELRDQLRDRRTIFMIAVLPLLLYPLIGVSFLQVAQFVQESPVRVLLIGRDDLPAEPRFVVGTDENEQGLQIAPELFSSPERARLVVLTADSGLSVSRENIERLARDALRSNEYDVVVYIPPSFAKQIDDHLLSDRDTGPVPSPMVCFSGAKDRSRAAYDRVGMLLDRWRDQMIELALSDRQIPESIAEPFQITNRDVSQSTSLRAAMWSKILPFVLIVWALTGAFYPAIDICAGEKERGTLETLLSSPAERREIVWGKLLTVVIFSIATSLLNLISLTVTGAVIIARINPIQSDGGASILGPPPLSTMGWLFLALLPLAALFSALALAFATMARSSKEGQYYLMPLLLVTMPLAVIPVMPSTEINLGNSLIPITGVMLLLRCLIEGDYASAIRYALPVIGVTALCCRLAVGWAVHQFNDESVLFDESERFDLKLLLYHFVRDRSNTPTCAEAFMCGVILLLLQFFVRLVAPAPISWSSFVVSTAIVQLALIVAPVLLMTTMLTSSPVSTLLLRIPRFSVVFAAVLLAVFLHPAAVGMRELVQWLYPISPETLEQLSGFAKIAEGVPMWQMIALLAFMPAICEELAFRGFILSGMRHIGSKGTAILLSSAFFGIVHGMLQQSLNAFVLGLLLGYIAVHTGSILPCMIFHGCHNGLQLFSASFMNGDFVESHPRMEQFLVESVQMPGSYVYRVPILILSILASGSLLCWFRSLPYTRSAEEQLQDTLDKQGANA
ncbi:MAG: ABC transporter permease subunit [Pirellulaceae bacterium]|nr:ABC transporter permease subunit [Pirellulaceae bacterium]